MSVIFFARQRDSALLRLVMVIVINIENDGVFDAVEVGAFDVNVKMRKCVYGPA